MKTLGLLLIVGGVWLCMTILLWFPGFLAIGVGALCYHAGRSAAKSEWTGLVHGALVGLIILSVTYGVFFWGYAVRLQIHSPHVAAQQKPVPRTEQNRVHPVKHAETATVSLAR